MLAHGGGLRRSAGVASSGAVKLAERVRQAAETDRAAAH